jgi:hypothetical protein
MNYISSMSRSNFLPDNFTLALIGTLVLARLLPCRGAVLEAVDHLTIVAIAARNGLVKRKPMAFDDASRFNPNLIS